MFLTRNKNLPRPGFRSLKATERIMMNDLVEDLSTGHRESVSKGYYAFLRGQRAEQARQIPQVFDVVRKTGR